jgi:hypothetical protein
MSHYASLPFPISLLLAISASPITLKGIFLTSVKQTLAFFNTYD